MQRYGSKRTQGKSRSGKYTKYSKKAARGNYGGYSNPKQGLAYSGFKGAAPIRAELKYSNFAFSNGPTVEGVSTGVMPIGTITHQLAGLGCGNDYNQRIGRKVSWKSMQIRGHVCRPLGGQMVSWRLLIVQDTQANGIAAGISNVLEGSWTSTTDAVVYNRSFGFINPTNRNRFKILFDKVGTFGPGFCNKLGEFAAADVTPAGGSALDNVPISKYIKLNFDTTYGGISNDTGSISTNGILMFLLSSGDPQDGTIPSNEPYFLGNIRLRYIDA